MYKYNNNLKNTRLKNIKFRDSIIDYRRYLKLKSEVIFLTVNKFQFINIAMCDSIYINKYLLVLEELQNIQSQKGYLSSLHRLKNIYLIKSFSFRPKS